MGMMPFGLRMMVEGEYSALKPMDVRGGVSIGIDILVILGVRANKNIIPYCSNHETASYDVFLG